MDIFDRNRYLNEKQKSELVRNTFHYSDNIFLFCVLKITRIHSNLLYRKQLHHGNVKSTKSRVLIA